VRRAALQGQFDTHIAAPHGARGTPHVKLLIAGGGTGGHLMPALALARVAAEAGHQVVLVGATRGIEAQILPRHPYPFHLLPFEPLYRRTWWRNLRWPLIALRAWRGTSRVLNLERPALVIGTGGYASGPVVWRAQRAGIPTALQEQNAFPGLATRLLAKNARQVHLGFPEARARLSPGPATEIFALGNPITPPEAIDPAVARAGFGLDPSRRTVLVFGGSQGARALNEALADAIIGGALREVNVLWGTGTAAQQRFTPLAQPGRVSISGFFDPIAPAYAAADFVVARAGAMTVAELCAWGKPSILVPLPTAAADHQRVNARALAAAGAAELLEESALSPESLARAITGLALDGARRDALAKAARARGNPDAARGILSKVLTLAGGD
jgi:UDP-N-acetylglucosamine--N-acetylmuramyl-(pentapeptide) pyrophosphoryl-undecaprenol N-acetylglucosamine transferase